MKKINKIQLALISSALILFVFQAFQKAYRDIGFDFTCYLLSSRNLLNSMNPYYTESVFQYLYPLSLTTILIPLTFLPYWLSCTIWFAVLIYSLYKTTEIIFNNSNIKISNSLTAIFIVFVFYLGVIQNNLLNGQVNLILILLCILFLEYYSRGNKKLAVIFLAIAISIKIMPIVLVAYLIVRKDIKSAFISIVIAVLLSLTPYLWLGNQLFLFYKDFFNILKDSAHILATDDRKYISFTISGFINNYIGKIDSSITQKVFNVFPLLIIITIDLFKKVDSIKLKMSVGYLYLLCIPLISPMSEIHHLIFTYPAFCFLFMELLNNQNTTNFIRTGVLLLFASITLLAKAYQYGVFYLLFILVLLIMNLLVIGNQTKNTILKSPNY